jgi:hypothetical protein
VTCYGAIIAIPTANVSRIDNGLKNADDLLRGIFSHMGNVGLGYLVDSVINELNTLSRSPNIIADDVILRLRKSFSGLVWLVYPYQSDADTLDKMFEVRT